MGNTSVTLELDPMHKQLLRYHLNQGGKGEEFFASEVRRVSDPYVPLRDSHLKSNVVVRPGSITYLEPYATRQYYENKGNWLEGMAHGGLRGSYWDKRAMADHGDEVVKSVAAFCGGEAK
jgi:hypothetical protein